MKITWMEHQSRALRYMQGRLFDALFMDTGTGKTPVALKKAEEWLSQNAFPGIVFCPNTLTGNWVSEAAHFDCNFRIARLEGSKSQRMKLIESPDWDVLVVNYEAARMDTVTIDGGPRSKKSKTMKVPSEMLKALLATKPKFAIFDELQRLKDRRASQTMAMRIISQEVRYRAGLTGTPVIHSPLDLWSEFDVLDPQAQVNHPLGYGSYSNFLHTIATVIPHPRLGHRAPIIKFKDPELRELKRRVAMMAFEARKEDCLDLPPRQFISIPLPMKTEQQKIYDQLRRDNVAFLKKSTEPTYESVNGNYGVGDIMKLFEDLTVEQAQEAVEEMASDRVSASVAVVLMTRQHQVTSGFVKTDDGVEKDIPSVKREWMEEKLPELTALEGDHKVVIFCIYTRDVDNAIKLCQEAGIGYVFLDGRNSSEADTVKKEFQTNPAVRVFIGQVATASTGLTLTAADYVVFYSNSFSAGDREQAQDRTYRIGQTRKVTYFDLLCEGTVDNYVLSNLSTKKDLALKSARNLREVLEYGDLRAK